MSLLPSGSRIISSPGCGAPLTLLAALADHAGVAPGLHLYTGLQLDASPFAEAVAAGALGLTTWHVTAATQPLVDAGRAHFVPTRSSDVPALFDRWGVTVALVRVSPPDQHGYCSLGPSTSYSYSAVKRAACVIAEIDDDVPRTMGQSMVHVSRFTCLVQSEAPMPEYRSEPPTSEARRIAKLVLDVLPERPILQMGIGAIPEAVTQALGDAGATGLRFAGMATDAMAGLFERGALDVHAVVPKPAIVAAEIMGTAKVMRFADRNPAVGTYPSAVAHDAGVLGEMPRFVSINSAVEVDVMGQVNGETVRGRQIAGIGGSIDYVESAYRSPGGLRITVLPSTASGGRLTRIVALLGGPATVARGLADIVITEHGIAHLRGRNLDERREALIAVAHPDHRPALENR